MDTYTLLREFADSWMLLFLFAFFVGVCAWAFWPGKGKDRDDAANIPFRNEGGDRNSRKEAGHG